MNTSQQSTKGTHLSSGLVGSKHTCSLERLYVLRVSLPKNGMHVCEWKSERIESLLTPTCQLLIAAEIRPYYS